MSGGDEKYKAKTLYAVTLLKSKLAHSLGKFAVIMEEITDKIENWAWRNAQNIVTL